VKAQGLLTHTAARYMVVAPLVGAFATGYGLCRAFLRSDTAEPLERSGVRLLADLTPAIAGRSAPNR
jgi:hypothetical protein